AKLQTKLTCSKQSTGGLKQWRSKMDEARGEEATEMRDPTRMYFERWGLLAPPLGKSELFKKSACSALPNRDTIPHQLPACNLRRAGVLACKKLSLFSTRISNLQYGRLKIS